MGAISLNMGPVGSNISAYRTENGVGGERQCVRSPLHQAFTVLTACARTCSYCAEPDDASSSASRTRRRPAPTRCVHSCSLRFFGDMPSEPGAC